jgi:hypothetical protein
MKSFLQNLLILAKARLDLSAGLWPLVPALDKSSHPAAPGMPYP